MKVAVVGAGYSGTMAAVEIARAAPEAEVTLIEKSGRFAEGAAYSTRCAGHLLNVRARSMSAFADDPTHFADWAAGRGYGPQDYVPRREFRAYLEAILAAAPEVRRIAGEAVAVEEGALVLASGERVPCDAAVLAGGNFPSRLPAMFGERAVNDPWSAEGVAAVARAAAEGGEVLLVGTGLTMVDMCVSLEEAGFAGRITACSRRGLVPRAHEPEAPMPPEWQPPARLAALVRALRTRTPWRAAVDGLRPHSVTLWQGLSNAEKKRFLRHLRPWWDVHRHRIAPTVARRIEAMRKSRQLEVVSGRIARVDDQEVTIARRGGGSSLTRRFATIINCTGPEGSVERVSDPLIRQLLGSRQARADSLKLGLEVDDGSRVQGSGEMPLYAVGPLSKGAFWEIVAVPDIRGQVRRVAQAIAAS